MFKLYSSSAGSGKTYTLTKEYLKLALSHESEFYFRHILAVTFTNAAAREMKERILGMLRTFAVQGSTHPMLQDILYELYPDTRTNLAYYAEQAGFISKKAKKVFKRILHRYSDFSVMTIDKFTQRLVSSFTEELGLPFSFETQLDSDLLESAVDVLLSRIGQEGEDLLTRIVENYYRESVSEGKSWGALPLRIREAAGDLLNEQSYLAMQKVANLEMEDWVSIRQQMMAFVRAREGEIAELAGGAYSLIQEEFLTEKDFNRGSQGIFKYFEDRRGGRKLWDAPNSYVIKTIEEGAWYGSKAPAFIQNKIDALKDELTTCFLTIERIRVSFSEQAILYRLLEKHIYNLSLLGEIRKEFNLLLRQNNQVHISDFNRRIMDIVSREPVPFIFERLGEKYNHILVDEFQDTSKLQFANLLPLLDNALAEGHFNLVVGDAKQSIYRFRGGDMDLILLLSQKNIGQLSGILGNGEFTSERLQSIMHYLRVDHLRTNRRSCREITHFNNDFFEFVAASVADATPMAVSVFDQNFRQEVPETAPDGGHVQLEFVEMTASEEEELNPVHDAIAVRTLTLVQELKDKGYDWRDLAILCRKKKEAASLAILLKDAGIPLISDDSLLLTNARSVNLLVAFMKVFQSSDDRLARYEAAYLFHCIVQEEVPTAAQHESIRQMCGERDLGGLISYIANQGVTLNLFRLRHLGVYEFCEQLISAFQLFEFHAETHYLFRFLDVVLEFSARRSNHLTDFLTYWETSKNKFSITLPANSDAVRITTIHKSKGLEYPVVIVPYAHWAFTPAAMSKLWVDLDDLGYEELTVEGTDGEKKLRSSVALISKSLEETALADQYKEERDRVLLENMNLVYVAFTRPIQRLYVIARQEKNWDRNQSRISHWLYNYLDQKTDSAMEDPLQSEYVISQGSALCMHAREESAGEVYRPEQIISNDRTSGLRLRRLANRIFDIDTFEKREDSKSKMRYALSYLAYRDDLPDAMRRLHDEGIIDSEEMLSLTKMLEDLMSREGLKELFNTTDKVLLNSEMLLPGGKTLTIDRTILRADGSAILINFAAGGAKTAARNQVRKLMEQYALMNNQRVVKGALVSLETNTVEWFE